MPAFQHQGTMYLIIGISITLVSILLTIIFIYLFKRKKSQYKREIQEDSKRGYIKDEKGDKLSPEEHALINRYYDSI